MNISLTGKRALVCGSTQGIGLAIAKELASLGAACTLIARNEEKLLTAIKDLPNQTLDHSILVADFSNHTDVAAVVGAFLQTQPVDILINNSGGPAAGPIADAEANSFLMAFEQHLLCNHVLTQLVSEGMKARQFGRIINVISTSVKIPLKGLGVSNTIRGAVASWAKTMANELAPFGITVNNILPGATATQRLSSIIENKAAKLNSDQATVSDEMIAEIPMKRFGDPSEIAAVAAFLATPAASYLTGTSIPVDGGRTGTI